MFKTLSSIALISCLLGLSACSTPNSTDTNTGGDSADKEMMFTVTLDNMESSTTPLAPGVFQVHTGANPFFTAGQADIGKGLKALAEDGDPSGLASMMPKSTVFNMPTGETKPGPATPGKSYSFSFKAKPGDKLSFATMYVQSNDGFYAADGLELFPGGKAINGDITAQIKVWDSGTEVNEEPGKGANQAPRQMGPNKGNPESKPVQLMSKTGDGFSYPSALKVTISKK